MERKWTAGRSLPSAAIAPTHDETRDANDLVYGTLRTYISVEERPPAAIHITRAAEPKSARIDVAAGAAIPPVPDPNFDELTEGGKATSAIAAERSEAACEKVLVAARIPTPTLKPTPTPDLVVTRTIWHPRSERRIVRVEVSGGAPFELKEGRRFGKWEVDTIEPSGVVFRYDGVAIFRRVGESR